MRHIYAIFLPICARVGAKALGVARVTKKNYFKITIMNQLTVKNTNTGLAITTATTAKEWYNATLPIACAAMGKLCQTSGALPIGKQEALHAVVAYKTTSLAALNGLAPAVAQKLTTQVSIRTLQSEIAANELQNPARARAIGAALTSGLQTKLRQLSLIYLNAGTDKMSEEDSEVLLSACENLVLTKYAGFSVAELDAAFGHAAANAEFKAYGSLNVQLLTTILNNYKAMRQKALLAILAEEEAMQKNIDFLNTVANKNDAAYEQAVAQLKALQAKNSTHATFHSCPHHYVETFVSLGVISFTPEEKKEIYAEARAQAAYDLANDAPSLSARKALAAFLSSINLVALPSLRPTGSDAVKFALAPNFDYKNITRESFAKHASTYYAKKLYYSSIDIYEKA